TQELQGEPPVGDLLGGALLPYVHPRAVHRLAAPGVHLEVRVSLELADLDQGAPVGLGEPLLRAAVAPAAPGRADQLRELLARGARPQGRAQVRPVGG